MGQLTSLSATQDGLTGRSSEPNLSGVSGFNDAPQGAGNGVYGKSSSSKGSGVKGINSDAGVGVWGESTGGVGVCGRAHHGDGVYGESDYVVSAGGDGGGGGDFAGVRGLAKDGFGVRGRSTKGIGVFGDSKDNVGVQGSTRNGDSSGIFGINSEKKPNTRASAFGGAGVTGYAIDAYGILGRSEHGIGISGEGGFYGGQFKGIYAQIRLVPGPTQGAPLNDLHHAGELYLDKVGDLFLCKQSGSPGVWKQIG